MLPIKLTRKTNRVSHTDYEIILNMTKIMQYLNLYTQLYANVFSWICLGAQ